MSKLTRKYILIPEPRPLYAMHRCFGPTHGPLSRPCLTPIDVIGELLKQSGDEKLTIYEVLMNEDRTTSEPVQLTLTNYKLPYAEIMANPLKPGQIVVNRAPRSVAPTFVIPPASKHKAPVPPEVEKDAKESPLAEAPMSGTIVVEPEEDEQQPAAEGTLSDNEVKGIEEADVRPDSTGNATVPDEDTGVPVGDADGTDSANQLDKGNGADADSADEPKVPDEPVIQSGPYAGMTKSQKRAAKEAARNAAAKNQ